MRKSLVTVLEAIKATDRHLDMVTAETPSWPQIRESWEKVVNRFSTSPKTVYDKGSEIYTVLKELSFPGVVIYGPHGYADLRSVVRGVEGESILKTAYLNVDVPAKDLTLIRAGFAPWNTWILLRLKEVPARWSKDFPHGDAWVLITNITSAFHRWHVIAPQTAYELGMEATETLFLLMTEKVDPNFVDAKQS